MENLNYDRDKAVAVATGIICFLVFLCGTSLGAFHSITTIGFIGILSVACYLIADIVICWAAYIDYKENGGAIEWAAWVVKYMLTVYLLFSGSCIAYTLMSSGINEKNVNARSKIYQTTYDNCMNKQGSKAISCRKLAESFNNDQSKIEQTELSEKKEGNKGIQAFIDWPLFKYMPGILGVLGFVGLTLVIKLKKPDHQSYPIFEDKTVSLRMRNPVAPLVISRKPSRSAIKIQDQNSASYFTLNFQASGWRVYDENNAYVKHISHAKYNSHFPTNQPTYQQIEQI